MSKERESNGSQLFEVDLGENGGLFLPLSVQEVLDWLKKEEGLWSWLRSGSFGGHVTPVNIALHSIYEGVNAAQRALQYPEPSSQANELAAMRAAIDQAFNQHRLPHSSTAVASAIEAYRQENGDQAASYFLSAFLPPQPGHHIEPKSFEQWKGWFQGLSSRFPVDQETARKQSAHEVSLRELQSRFSSSLARRDAEAEGIRLSMATSESGFREFLAKAGDELAADRQQWGWEISEAREAHQKKMDGIESAFREAMALRAPVEYWEKKAEDHKTRAGFFSKCVAGLLVVSPLVLLFAIWLVLRNLPSTQIPSPWQIGALLSFGLFLVWSTRIVVRNYLSQVHLYADAQERVVMVKTYLSLTEDKKIESAEDRQIILHALFRPASDGLIKDEGVPLSLADLITKK
jgi:hypothetical protein